MTDLEHTYSFRLILNKYNTVCTQITDRYRFKKKYIVYFTCLYR